MNTCKPNRGKKTVVIGGLCGFGLPAAALLLAAAAFGSLSDPLRLAALGGGLLLAALLIAAVYRTLYVVPPHLTWDQDTVTFHFSRQERLTCPRSQLQNTIQAIEKAPWGHTLRLRQGEEVRPFPLYTDASRHRDAVRLLQESGLWQSDL